MLSTILERGLLVVQSLLKVGDFLFKRCRFVNEAFVQYVDRDCNEPKPV